jgi:hypothetical protein
MFFAHAGENHDIAEQVVQSSNSNADVFLKVAIGAGVVLLLVIAYIIIDSRKIKKNPSTDPKE